MKKKVNTHKSMRVFQIDERHIRYNGGLYRLIPPPRKYHYPSTPERRKKLRLYMQEYRKKKKNVVPENTVPPAYIDVPSTIPHTTDLSGLQDFVFNP